MSMYLVIFLQKCVNEDYEYNPDDYVQLVPKQVLPDIIQECPKAGETCCVPKPPRCEDTKGHRCMEADVS